MKSLICLLSIIVSAYGFTGIIPIQSIKEIALYAENGSEVLVVFDIDDTLTILSEPAFQRPNFSFHHASTFKEILSGFSKREQALILAIPLLTTPSELIEIDTAEFIEKLQRKGIKTLALTAAPAGEIKGELVENRRIAELRRVGIDFSRSFAGFPEMTLPGFSAPDFGRDPLFKQGVILGNVNNKGDILVTFLKHIAYTPEKILFIDDRKEHLHTVEKALLSSFPETEFLGFHFQTEDSIYEQIDVENFKAKWDEVAMQSKELVH
jgi:hypothetical protein